MTRTKKPTLRDVASRAGVSTGTVSLVLNGSDLVAKLTRERVSRVIAELGYVYDRGAAQLRSRRTNIVGLSICNLVNPYFAEVAAGVENTLNDLGYALLMGNCGESVAKQRQFLDSIREYNVDGMLMMPARDTRPEDVAGLRDWNIPFVMVSRYVRGAAFDYAGPDNRHGTALATRHLIGLDHSRIAFVGLNPKTTSSRDRAAGYRAAMRGAGLPVAAEMMVECGDTRQDGFQAIHGLFELPEPPTAVVCFNDILAFGVMLGLRALGLVPGKDCSVIGHDDVAEAALWRPPLSTVAVDAHGIGVAAAELLHSRMESGGQPVRRRVLDTSLVVRETCGPPPRTPERKPARPRGAGSRRREQSPAG